MFCGLLAEGLSLHHGKYFSIVKDYDAPGLWLVRCGWVFLRGLQEFNVAVLASCSWELRTRASVWFESLHTFH